MATHRSLPSVMKGVINPTNLSHVHEETSDVGQPAFHSESSSPRSISDSENRLHHSLVPQYSSASSVNIDDTGEAGQQSGLVEGNNSECLRNAHTYENVRSGNQNAEPYSGCSASEIHPSKYKDIQWSHVDLLVSTIATMSATLQKVELDPKFKDEVGEDKVFDEAGYLLGPKPRGIYFPDKFKDSETARTFQRGVPETMPPKKRAIATINAEATERSVRKTRVKGKYRGISKQSSRTRSTSVPSPGRPFQCHLCTSSFDRGGHLRVHIGAVHEKLRPFKCNECSSSFGHSSSLQRHVRTVHQKSEEKSMRRQASVSHDGANYLAPVSNSTRVTHTRGGRPKPYRCTMCRASFSCISLLIRHKELKHSAESDKTDTGDRSEDRTSGDTEIEIMMDER